MADKRIIEQVTSEEILNDDWLIKDSVTEGTTKVQPSTLKEYVNTGMATEQALLSETQERESNDETLSGRITVETEARTNAVNSLSNRITSEATARENADSTIRRLLGDETTARTSGDNELSGRITSEVTARTNADSTLGNRITNEANTREFADTSLSNRIDSEASTRNIADTTLAKNFADEYDASTSYEVGDLCIKDLVLYRCTTATTGTWDDTKWEEVTVDGVLDEAGKVDDVQTYGGNTLVTNKIADLSALTIKKSIPSTPTDIANFTDGAEMVMPSLTVGVEPQQDLHGYDSPWVGGAGKNKLPLTVEGIKAVNTYHSWSGNSTTINNVTITIETSDSGDVTGIRFNGTASADITFNLASNITISNGSYIWSNDQIVNISNLWLSLSSPNIAITLSSEKERNVTVSNGSIGGAYIYASSGNAFNNVVFKPMMRLASVQDATFAPYSNICPISGWDEVNVTVADDVDNPTVENVYTIDLGETRYGGRLEIVNGVARFVATKGYIASYDGETLPSDWISDRDVYSEGTTPTIGAEVVYTLSEPVIIPLGNYPISTLEGENNVFADSGEILDGEYIADASTVIASLDARITALENA